MTARISRTNFRDSRSKALASFADASALVAILAEETRSDGLEAAIASDGYALFGRGRHTAMLNMGDCFAYACAKANGAKLLYEGDDFAQTDLA